MPAVDLDAVLGRRAWPRCRPRPWPRAPRGGGRRRRRRSPSPRTARRSSPARPRATPRRACAGSPGTSRSARRTGYRSLAYASAMSKSRRAVPTISAASATVRALERRPRARRRSIGLRRRRPRRRRPRTAAARSRSVAHVGAATRRRRTTRDRRARRHDRDPVDPVGLGHERLHRLVVRAPDAVGARERDRAGDLAGEHGRQALVPERARAAGANSAAVGKNGPGAATYPVCSGNRHRSRAAARRRGRRTRARCAPQRVGGRRVVDVRPQQRRRALLREQRRARCRAAAPAPAVSVKSIVSSGPREPEHALGDDVALDLGRAAGDRVGEAHEEACGPSGRAPRRARGRRPRRTRPGAPCRARSSSLPSSDVAIFMYECSGADDPWAKLANPL